MSLKEHKEKFLKLRSVYSTLAFIKKSFFSLWTNLQLHDYTKNSYNFN